jgi:hypothetical protein
VVSEVKESGTDPNGRLFRVEDDECLPEESWAVEKASPPPVEWPTDGGINF